MDGEVRDEVGGDEVRAARVGGQVLLGHQPRVQPPNVASPIHLAAAV